MVHLPSSLLLLLSISTAFSLPTASTSHRSRRDINISHISKLNGTAVTHTIDSAALDPALKAAIEGSDLNINLIGNRRRSVEKRDAGISNSTINLTVISKRDQAVRKVHKKVRPVRKVHSQSKDQRKTRQIHNSNSTLPVTNSTLPATNSTVLVPSIPVAESAAQPQVLAETSSSATSAAADTPTHHNILIDASTSGAGLGGGISNSTININLNSVRRERRKVHLGDHSILVDTEHVSNSTVHVNILPVRAMDKSVGKHSILIDSSSGNEQGITSAGDHSGVVDTSSGSSDSNSTTTGIQSSTINMTVVAPKASVDGEEEETAAAPALVKRAESNPAWSAAIKNRSFDPSSTAEEETFSPIVVVEEFATVEEASEVHRRSHASRPSRFGKKL